MCGRYVLFSPEEIAEIRGFLAEMEKASYDIGEVFPTNRAPVIREPDQGGQQTTLMTWGFPHFKGSGVIINARSESAGDKPMFAKSLRQRRCVVLSTGFFEWSGAKGSKIKHLFNRPDSRALFMAGLYNEYTTAEKEERFVILTTEANESVEAIHTRMPVILLPEEIDTWLHGDYASLLDRQHIDLVHALADDEPLSLL